MREGERQFELNTGILIFKMVPCSRVGLIEIQSAVSLNEKPSHHFAIVINCVRLSCC